MRISEGIQHALEEAAKSTQEKVAGETVVEETSFVTDKLKLAAQKIRENGVDVKITDLQEFTGALQ